MDENRVDMCSHKILGVTILQMNHITILKII